MTKNAIAGLLALVLSAGAHAFQCPGDMKTIDEALARNPQISDDKIAEVKKLRAEGESLHKAGKHKESVDTLARALAILGTSEAPLNRSSGSNY